MRLIEMLRGKLCYETRSELARLYEQYATLEDKHQMMKADKESYGRENRRLHDALIQCKTQKADLENRLNPDIEISECEVQDQDWARGVIRKNLSHANLNVICLDREYHPASDEEILYYIFWDDTNLNGYIPEQRDCDKFAGLFWARFRWFLGRNNVAFTIDWSGRHAYIIFLRRNESMWVYEPQNDEWWEAGDRGFQQPYPLDNVMIII